jgi:hypothetical protein
MTALHVEAAVRQGDTFPIFGVLRYADGAPFNLAAGAAVEWTLYDCDGNMALSYSLASDAGQLVVTDVCGKITITILATDSAELAPGVYTDELVATDPNGYVSTQWTGRIKVRPRVPPPLPTFN